MKTTIIQAAILRHGRIFTGKRHGDIIREMVEYHGIKPPIDVIGNVQGFVTNGGQFVTRSEAAKIAFESGQIKKQKRILFSEDIY